jgi:cytochrome c
MTTHKTLITALGVIAATLLSNPAQALDAAGLYQERTCIACHGAEGRVPAMDQYPRLAGQGAEYMLAQMKDIKSGTRTNAHAAAMKNVMHLISDEEMVVIVDWLAGLPE